MFPLPAARPEGTTEPGYVVPFGITTALPIDRHPEADLSGLTLCPDRQVSLAANGEPFLHAPSMATSIETVTTTVEDMQTFDDNEGTDTD